MSSFFVIESKDTFSHRTNPSLYTNPQAPSQVTNLISFHAFIALETGNWWLSLENKTQVLYIQRSKQPYDVINHLQGEPRTTGIGPATGVSHALTYIGHGTMTEIIYFKWRKNLVVILYTTCPFKIAVILLMSCMFASQGRKLWISTSFSLKMVSIFSLFAWFDLYSNIHSTVDKSLLLDLT